MTKTFLYFSSFSNIFPKNVSCNNLCNQCNVKVFYVCVCVCIYIKQKSTSLSIKSHTLQWNSRSKGLRLVSITCVCSHFINDVIDMSTLNPSLCRTSILQRAGTLHQHQRHQGQAQPERLEQWRLPHHFLHLGVSARRLPRLDHGAAHLPHKELHPVRPARGHLVRAADEDLQQRRLRREKGQVCDSQLRWQWVNAVTPNNTVSLDSLVPPLWTQLQSCFWAVNQKSVSSEAECIKEDIAVNLMNELIWNHTLFSLMLTTALFARVVSFFCLSNWHVSSLASRHYCTVGEGSQCGQGQLWRWWRHEDDGHNFLRAGGHRRDLHRAVGAETEKKGAKAQETSRWTDGLCSATRLSLHFSPSNLNMCIFSFCRCKKFGWDVDEVRIWTKWVVELVVRNDMIHKVFVVCIPFHPAVKTHVRPSQSTNSSRRSACTSISPEPSSWLRRGTRWRLSVSSLQMFSHKGDCDYFFPQIDASSVIHLLRSSAHLFFLLLCPRWQVHCVADW